MKTKRQLARDDASTLAEYYSVAHNKLLRILIDGQSSLTSRKRAKEMLVQVNDVISRLDDQSRKFIDARIPVHYKKHAKEVIATINKAGVNATFTKVHENAIQAIADKVNDKFAVGLTATSRKASQIINLTLQNNITREIAKGKILGSSLDEVTADVIKEIKDQGITGLVDKRGRQLNIESYARTVAYTEIAEAGRTAVKNVALQYGFDLVRISSHNSTHKECAQWEGKVVSLTGSTKGYYTLDDVLASGWGHPNCAHTYTVIAEEDVTYDMKS